MRRMIGIAMAMLGCAGDVRVPKEIPPTPTVVRGSFASTLLLTGQLKAAAGEPISSPPKVWGLTIKWMVEDGAMVKKGDRVMEMDSTAVLENMSRLQSNVQTETDALASLRRDYQISIATKTFAQQETQNALAAAKLQAAIPADAQPRRVYEDQQVTLFKAQSAHVASTRALASERKIARLSISQQQVVLEQAQRAYALAEQKLEQYTVVAPRDGVVVAEKNASEGRSFRPGDKVWAKQTVMTMPTAGANMIVNAILSDVDDGRVHVGMGVRCILDAYPTEVLNGSITELAPVAKAPNEQSLRREFSLKIALDTKTEHMRTGMSVRVELTDMAKEDVLLVPRTAVQIGPDSTIVLLANGGSAEVAIDACSSQQCMIRSGLSEGTKLRSRNQW